MEKGRHICLPFLLTNLTPKKLKLNIYVTGCYILWNTVFVNCQLYP